MNAGSYIEYFSQYRFALLKMPYSKNPMIWEYAVERSLPRMPDGTLAVTAVPLAAVRYVDTSCTSARRRFAPATLL